MYFFRGQIKGVSQTACFRLYIIRPRLSLDEGGPRPWDLPQTAEGVPRPCIDETLNDGMAGEGSQFYTFCFNFELSDGQVKLK